MGEDQAFSRKLDTEWYRTLYTHEIRSDLSTSAINTLCSHPRATGRAQCSGTTCEPCQGKLGQSMSFLAPGYYGLPDGFFSYPSIKQNSSRTKGHAKRNSVNFVPTRILRLINSARIIVVQGEIHALRIQGPIGLKSSLSHGVSTAQQLCFLLLLLDKKKIRVQSQVVSLLLL